MGFRDDQVTALRSKLSARVVQTKVVNGFSLSYVEGWYTIAEANRIFGFDGWDRETLSAECVWQGQAQGIPSCSYTARVRVRVHAGETTITREGSGFGTGTGNTLGEAHEKALKEAETDAMKRALATFGNRFGLCLYDKDQQGLAKPKNQSKANGSDSTSGWILKNAEGEVLELIQAPQVFYSKARKLLEGLRNPNLIRRLWQNNEEALKAIRIAHPDLRDTAGAHYSVLFARLCKEQARIAELGNAATVRRSGMNGRPPQTTANTSRTEGDLDKDHGEQSTTENADQSALSNDTAEKGSVNGYGHGCISLEGVSPGENGPQANGRSNNGHLQGEADVQSSKTSETRTDAVAQPHDLRTASDNAAAPQSMPGGDHMGSGMDKSALPIGVPKRIRDKEHLKTVAAQPCLVCGRSPSHAHHLTFVQPRARGLKASDEWVVPLCFLHHRELHDRGDEREWWRVLGSDPVNIAIDLWNGHQTRRSAARVTTQLASSPNRKLR